METIFENSNPSLKIPYEGTIVASHTSELQTWTIMNTKCQGLTLFINGQLQSCKNDEYIYHEMFVHPLMSGSAKPKNVLILGGAEGCTLREVLRWPTVESVVQVDWDKDLVSYFQTEQGSTWNGGSYKDPRVQLYFEDAFRWIQNSSQTFDAIFIDLFDPTSSDADYVFFTNLLLALQSHLSPGGGISINAGQVGPGHSSVVESLALFIKRQFPEFHRFALKTFIHSFLGEWCFLTVASKSWTNNFHKTKLPEGLRRFTSLEIIHNFWPKDYPLEILHFSKDNIVSPKKLDNHSDDYSADWFDFEYNANKFS
jgi:spermidine synthase